MKRVTPYQMLDLLIKTGEPIPLDRLARRLLEPGDDLDRVKVDVDVQVDSYIAQCAKIGEHPVVSLDYLNDELTSDAIQDPDEIFADAAARINLANRAWITYYLRTMPWTSFEELCREMLEKMYVTDACLTNRGPDGGIDFTGKYFNPNYKAMVYPIIGQAKQWAAANPVGVHEVRDLTANLANHDDAAVQGFLITTSYFTGPAAELAKKSKRKIHLWDIRELTERILEFKLGVTSEGGNIMVLDRPHWDRFLEGR